MVPTLSKPQTNWMLWHGVHTPALRAALGAPAPAEPYELSPKWPTAIVDSEGGLHGGSRPDVCCQTLIEARLDMHAMRTSSSRALAFAASSLTSLMIAPACAVQQHRWRLCDEQLKEKPNPMPS
jgi:hypothetical protein